MGVAMRMKAPSAPPSTLQHVQPWKPTSTALKTLDVAKVTWERRWTMSSKQIQIHVPTCRSAVTTNPEVDVSRDLPRAVCSCWQMLLQKFCVRRPQAATGELYIPRVG